MINIYTFENFWSIFYYFNKVRKTDKSRCLNLWDKCNFSDRKKRAIKECCKMKISAFEYLVKVLNSH